MSMLKDIASAGFDAGDIVLYDGRNLEEWLLLAFPVIYETWGKGRATQKTAFNAWLEEKVDSPEIRVEVQTLIHAVIDHYHDNPESDIHKVIGIAIQTLVDSWDPKAKRFSAPRSMVLLQIAVITQAIQFDRCMQS